MSQRKVVRELLEEIAEETVPGGSVDLAPGVKSRYLAAQGGMPSTRRGLRWAVGAVAALVVVSGTLFIVPTTRATLNDAIEDLLRRMGLHLAPASETNDTTVMSVEAVAPVATMEVIPLDDIRAQAPFAVRLPGWLPEGVAYETGLIHNKSDDGSTTVALTYRLAGVSSSGPDTPLLWLEMSAGDLPPYYLSEEAAQTAEVKGLQAIYLHGGWTTDEPVQPGETTNGLFWDSAVDGAYLSWVEDGIAYRIQAHGLGLELADLVRIAESLE